MKKFLAPFLAFALLFGSGCGKRFYERLDMRVAAGELQTAEKMVDLEKKQQKEGVYNKQKNKLLYYFDKGALAQANGDYGDSTETLNKADRLIEKYYTRSIGDETWSFFSNDLNLKYRGEDFEQVMVNIYKALNFMYSGDFRGARIEAKKVDFKLNTFEDRAGENAFYVDDALARYISAFAYEALGEPDDAYIDYKKSYRVYKKYRGDYGAEIPEQVKKDIMRLAEARGFYDDLKKWEEEFKGVEYEKYSRLKNMGEVLIVIYDGMPAYKKDNNGVPYFKKRGYALASVKVKAREGYYPGFVAQNVSEMAVKNLEKKNALILLKAAARRVVKGIAKEIPVLNLFIGKEKADTRCWRTVPARFIMVRVPVNPGKNVLEIEMELYSKKKKTEIKKIEVEIRKGEKKVLPFFVYSI